MFFCLIIFVPRLAIHSFLWSFCSATKWCYLLFGWWTSGLVSGEASENSGWPRVGHQGAVGESAIYIFIYRHNKMIEDDLKIYWTRLSNLHLIQLYRPDGGRRTRTVRTWKWMVGRRSFPSFWISAYFQVRTVSCREGKSSRVKIYLPEKMQSHWSSLHPRNLR